MTSMRADNVTKFAKENTALSSEIKAFPMVCVCSPKHWSKTIKGDGSTDITTAGKDSSITLDVAEILRESTTSGSGSKEVTNTVKSSFVHNLVKSLLAHRRKTAEPNI